MVAESSLKFRMIALTLAGWAAVSIPGLAWAFTPDPFRSEPPPSNDILPPPSISPEDIYAQQEHIPFYKYIAERTQLGLGYDAVFDDNILLHDNDKLDDIIQTLEGAVIFNDPRGSILYGAQYEVNAFRYIRNDANAIDHDLVSYFDLDPGGRTRFRADYSMNVNNSLTFGTVGIDLLRTGTDFQRTVTHEGKLGLRYALTKTNALKTFVLYNTFDDQATNDASTDRQTLRAGLDMEHALTPTWTLFGGTTFEKITVPGDGLKDNDAYGGRFGVRHELSPSEKLDGALEVDRPQFRGQERGTDINYSGSWTHLINPRTDLKLSYANDRTTSFVSGRSQFRSRTPSLGLSYELTPRIKTNFRASYEKQVSEASGTSPAQEQRQYNLRGGLIFQVREQMHLTLEYSNTRSKSRDITSHIFSFGVEASF